MEDLIESIRGATAPEATDDARAEGANACREILRSLEPDPPFAPAPASTAPVAHVAQLVTALRGVPMEQLFDLAIEKLRAIVPSDAVAAKPAAFNIPLVPVPQR
ncbi:MAG: hypothetical protein H0T46_27290 [Deltaproteobacteria bacterium]|nr:hypothetical protein [Deltaproteobacteria bacterium]